MEKKITRATLAENYVNIMLETEEVKTEELITEKED